MTRLCAIVDSVDEVRSTKSTPQIIEALKAAAAEEVQAWYQYLVPAKFLVGPERVAISESFKELADDELSDHFDSILARLNELGADVSSLMNLYELSRLAGCQYIAPQPPYNVLSCVEDNIKAEQCAITTYENLLELTVDVDIVTNDLVKRILADEVQHLQTLIEFKADIEAIQSLG